MDFSEDVADNADDRMPGLKKKESDIIKQQCCASVCESCDLQSLVSKEPSSSDELKILQSSSGSISNYSENDRDQFNMDTWWCECSSTAIRRCSHSVPCCSKQ